MQLASALQQFDRRVEALSGHELTADTAGSLEAARSVYLLAPSSFLGHAFACAIALRLLQQGKEVALVDDTLSAAPAGLEACRVLNTQDFRGERPLAGLSINLANTVFVHRMFSVAARSAGIPMLDIVPVLAELSMPVIYQEATLMRAASLAKLDEYKALARALDDELSVQTLAAFLEMRVTLDRNAMLPVLCSLEDEYFSLYPTGKQDLTFTLGPDEVLCDVGAHVGSTVRKFLSATQWQYAAIHAFEPDTANFAGLTQGPFANLADFHPRNIALSDQKGVLSFAETGTMGSRLDVGGNVQVPTSTLDDEVPHASFIKMDVEGHETKILQGARRLISQSKPRLAITAYHYADDLLDIVRLIRDIEPRYRLRLRHHSYYYYDTIVYADIPS
jgi:FkbM family methyltransferase